MIRRTRWLETSIALLICPSDIVEPTFMLHEDDELTGSSGPLVCLPFRQSQPKSGLAKGLNLRQAR